MLGMCGTIFKWIGGVEHIEKNLAMWECLQICIYIRWNCKHYVKFKNSEIENPNSENVDMSLSNNIEKKIKKK